MSVIASKTLPSLKTASKSLYLELVVLQNKANSVHNAKDLEKQKARLQYQKLTAIKENKDVADFDNKIAALENKLSNQDSDKLADLKLYDVLLEKGEGSHKINFLDNVTKFLRSQRQYTELLERYNSGLLMQQDDNVRKTANRVGLSVPQ